MCGIAGEVSYSQDLTIREHDFLRMQQVLAPRGPDQKGLYLSGNAALVHRRLAVIDIEEYVNLPESIFGTGELYILRAYGDSMVDSGIEPGVLVVVDKNAKPKVDDIVVVLNADNENTLKQYKGKKNGKYVFAYMNEEKYPGETIELDSFVCQGVAKHMIKSL